MNRETQLLCELKAKNKAVNYFLTELYNNINSTYEQTTENEIDTEAKLEILKTVIDFIENIR
jgi:hypothetical protein